MRSKVWRSIQLTGGLKEIEEDPDVVQAQEAHKSALAAVEAWITDNGFGTMGEIESQVSDALSAMGCNTRLASHIVEAENMAAVDALIAEPCGDKIVSADSAQAIKALVPFIENPEYAALRLEATLRWTTYIGTRDALGYLDTNLALQTFLAFHSYEDIKRELDVIAEDMGFSTRLKHAKLAASTILDLTRLDNKARNRETVISLEQFSTVAKHLHSLTTDYE